VATELAERYRHVVEVTPTFGRGRYSLTARGYVGFVQVSGWTIEIRPKLPWELVRVLFVPIPDLLTPNPTPAEGDGGLLDLFAHRLSSLMLDRADTGPLRGYVETEVREVTVRGRIDLPKQVRNPQPGLFDQLVDEFTADVEWNRYPKSVAVRLLVTPGLSSEARAALARAVAAFAEVNDTVVSPAERAALRYDARSEPYRNLFDWCDLLEADQVLVNLEAAFEGYATRLFREAVGATRVAAQSPLSFVADEERTNAVTLVPDITLLTGGTPVSVWDAKWKRPDPTSGDVHQVMAYAAALAVPVCGLVYPGCRFRLDTLRAAGSKVALRLLKLPMTDDPNRLRRTLTRLRQACRL
jgi:5-methylcytosine-specific restriction endonuclease McrBC regulatory subunit McrC